MLGMALLNWSPFATLRIVMNAKLSKGFLFYFSEPDSVPKHRLEKSRNRSQTETMKFQVLESEPWYSEGRILPQMQPFSLKTSSPFLCQNIWGLGNVLGNPQKRSLLDGVWERVTRMRLTPGAGTSESWSTFGSWHECGWRWERVPRKAGQLWQVVMIVVVYQK